MVLTEIKAYLKKNASSERAEKMKQVAPGAKLLYGVKMPVLNELAKLNRNGGFELVESLWNSGSHEEKILAAKILRFVAKKDPLKAIEFVRSFSKEIDNWAICDALGMQSLKTLNKKYPEEIFQLANEMSASKNMWQRRLSLVLVEDFTKQPALHPRIIALIDKQKGDPEYYIRKAVTWLERNLSKGR